MDNKLNEILDERGSTHGGFHDNARVAQNLKDVIRREPGSKNLTMVQTEALEMIFLKISRIVTGNPNEPDHWDDIAGYATLCNRWDDSGAKEPAK